MTIFDEGNVPNTTTFCPAVISGHLWKHVHLFIEKSEAHLTRSARSVPIAPEPCNPYRQ